MMTHRDACATHIGEQGRRRMVGAAQSGRTHRNRRFHCVAHSGNFEFADLQGRIQSAEICSPTVGVLPTKSAKSAPIGNPVNRPGFWSAQKNCLRC